MKDKRFKFIGWGFVVLTIVFFILYLRRLDLDVIADIDVNWIYLVAAIIFALMFRIWGVFVWQTILRSLGASKTPPFAKLISVYSKAWIGRYIPGTITWIAAKIYLASSYGISKSRLAVSSIIEGAMQILALVAVSTLLLGFDARTEVIPTQIKVLLILMSVLMFISLYPPVFNKMIGFAYAKLRKKQVSTELVTNNRTNVRSFFLYVIGAFLSGTFAFLLAKAVYPELEVNLFLYVVGTYNLAGAIGTATPFVPSGIGVRDGIQLVLLSLIMPEEIALVITVLSRLMSALIDVFFLLLGFVLDRTSNQRLEKTSS